MYCPQCGREVQIVPDFEPEIEEEMTGVLEKITDHLIRSEKAEKKERKIEQEEKRRSRISFYSTVIAAVLAGIVFLIFFASNQMATVETQLARAEKAAAEKDYEKAISCMLKASEMDATDLDIRNRLGEYYLLDGQTANAIAAFYDVIRADRENENAYRNLIGIYEKENDYVTINQLVRDSDSDQIVNTFIKYIANPPQFNYPQGTYEERIPLKLTANTSGTVYFTMDGSEPDENSQVYTTPLFLDDGIYTVRAFFVNEYGIKSETAVQIYQIHLDQAHEPEVSLNSGEYTQPQMITVTVPQGESVYYTVDGSQPTKDSILYSNPIALPIGGSTYQFISYTEEGTASEVVTRNYPFVMQSEIDLPTAVNLLVVGLVEHGVVTDFNGSVPDKKGRNVYVCSSAVCINERNYFLVVEYYEDLLGVDTKTGNLYCVDAQTGELFKANVGEDGYYSVVSF